MPTLNNPTSQDIQFVPRHEMVPAGGSIEISDDEAAQVNTASGIWTITAAPQRRQVTRGGSRVEVTKAPEMETR